MFLHKTTCCFTCVTETFSKKGHVISSPKKNNVSFCLYDNNLQLVQTIWRFFPNTQNDMSFGIVFNLQLGRFRPGSQLNLF